MVVKQTINHGVALFIGFIFAIIIEEAISGQFTDGVLSIIADHIVTLYVVLVVALFATRMGSGLSGGNGMMR